MTNQEFENVIGLFIVICVAVTVFCLFMKCVSSIWTNFNEGSFSTKQVFAIDTESVGGGPRGSENILARVSIVDRRRRVIYDHYVKPSMPEVAWILQNCILFGHDLKFDLNALELTHPANHIRDTSLYKAFRHTITKPSLKYLAKKYLKRDIQLDEHCSVKDALAAMDLYLLFEHEWEYEMA